MDTTVFTVSQPTIIEYDIKKSRFVAAIMPCDSDQAALQQLNQLATQHRSANHLAFAWRIRQTDGVISERCHDAGEPSGTAGRPILAPLEGEHIVNCVIAVVRYFGGIKLGTGGLARAYGLAAKRAIEAATLIPWIEMKSMVLTLDYSQLQLLEYHLSKCEGYIIDQTFTDCVSVTIRIPSTEQHTIKQLFNWH